MQLAYQYMAIFFNFSPTSNHLHSLQVENCDSNSRLVVDEDDSGKLRLEKVNSSKYWVIFSHLKLWVAVARHNFKWVGSGSVISLLWAMTIVWSNVGWMPDKHRRRWADIKPTLVQCLETMTIKPMLSECYDGVTESGLTLNQHCYQLFLYTRTCMHSSDVVSWGSENHVNLMARLTELEFDVKEPQRT